MAPRGYPGEFGRRVIDLVGAGRAVATVAAELGISGQSICTWRCQARIDAGLEAGMTTAEHAELTMGRGIAVCRQTVETLMRRAGLRGVWGRPKFRRAPDVATAADLVDRHFARAEPDRLWVTDITEHPTREGKVCCTVVPGCLQPPGRGLVDRFAAHGVDGDQCVGDGDGQPQPHCWRDRLPAAPKAPSPRLGRSPSERSTRGCCLRWTRSATALTMPWPSRSVLRLSSTRKCAGYRSTHGWLVSFGPIAAVGVESTGSCGAALARSLAERGCRVVEVNQPHRHVRARRGKDDAIDAEAAARKVLSGEATPAAKDTTGIVEAIRQLSVARNSAVKARTAALCQPGDLLVTAPAALREQVVEHRFAVGDDLADALVVAQCRDGVAIGRLNVDVLHEIVDRVPSGAAVSARPQYRRL